MYQRGKDKTAERAAPLVQAALGPAERILVGARVESGLSRWWLLLSSYASFLRKYYYMVLTDHHVVLIRNSRWSGRPTQVETATPRDQAQASDYKPGVVFGSFIYTYPGRTKPMRMKVHRIYRQEIESMLGQLGAFGLGAGQPYGQDLYAPPPRQ
jgi:hypothetical protein